MPLTSTKFEKNRHFKVIVLPWVQGWIYLVCTSNFRMAIRLLTALAVNNAGVATKSFEITQAGFELAMGVSN
jgi:hypothetical protein